MVRRSDYSVNNTPKRDDKGKIISAPKRKSFYRSREFLLPMLCIALVVVCGIVVAVFS